MANSLITTHLEGQGRCALITGASSGIGLELAKLFAGAGFDLVLVARRKDRLESLAEELRRLHEIKVLVLPADLAQPGGPAEVEAGIRKAGLSVDVLVNNAGFGDLGKFAGRPLESYLRMLAVNVSALTELTHRFLPGMVARGWGRVMNIASVLAFNPCPYMAVYAASKAYVLSFSEALSTELRGTGVTVTALCPGSTETEFNSAADLDAKRIPKAMIMDAPSVAALGYRACLDGVAVRVTGAGNRIQVVMSHWVPRPLNRLLRASIFGRLIE